MNRGEHTRLRVRYGVAGRFARTFGLFHFLRGFGRCGSGYGGGGVFAFVMKFRGMMAFL